MKLDGVEIKTGDRVLLRNPEIGSTMARIIASVRVAPFLILGYRYDVDDVTWFDPSERAER